MMGYHRCKKMKFLKMYLVVVTSLLLSVLAFLTLLSESKMSLCEYTTGMVSDAACTNKTKDSNSHERLITPNLTIPFLINEPDLCHSFRPSTFLLIYVHSAPNHFKHRQQIRQTYGKEEFYKTFGLTTVFIVGKSKQPSTESALRLESAKYKDIIQGDFDDRYHNMTLKAVTGLRWIAEHCSMVPYVLKVDDDVLVDIFRLLRRLKAIQRHDDTSSKKNSTFEPRRDKIHCRTWDSKPIRNPKSKFYISVKDFPKETYPKFCSGSAYFMAGYLVEKLHRCIPEVPYLWLDDVFVTGLLRDAAGIELESINDSVALYPKELNRTMITGYGLFGHLTGEPVASRKGYYWNIIRQRMTKESTTSGTTVSAE